MRLAGISLFFCLFSLMVFAQEAEEKREHKYKVERHLFARSINIGKDGQCQPRKNTQIKAWYVLGFPAEVPPFETCTTISSKTGKGEVEFKLSIVSKDKEKILVVDGVLDLGIDGKASQAIDWDHVKIPAGGIYHMVVEVEGKRVRKFPMKFALKKRRKR
ncbi:hypothetical protein ACFL2F_02965 [Myxococcota bacterium]